MKVHILDRTEDYIALECPHWILLQFPRMSCLHAVTLVIKNWVHLFLGVVVSFLLFPYVVVVWLLLLAGYLVYFSLIESETTVIKAHKKENYLKIKRQKIGGEHKTITYRISDLKLLTRLVVQDRQKGAITIPVITTVAGEAILLPDESLIALLSNFLHIPIC